MMQRHVGVSRARKAAGGLPLWAWPVSCLACAAVAVFVTLGVATMSGTKTPTNTLPSGTVTVGSDELDDVIATYTYGGTTHDITVQAAVDASSTSADDDGNYAVPTASTVVSVAQQQVLSQIIQDEGITATDDEISAYAETQFGTDSLSDVATQYGLTEDYVRSVVASNVCVAKLREQVGASFTETAPTEPVAPSDGSEDAASADYATYIIGLAGDEWDASTGMWASSDGTYATALASYDVTADLATYAAAEAAYNVAYSAYEADYSAANTTWSTYLDGKLSTMTIDLYTGAV